MPDDKVLQRKLTFWNSMDFLGSIVNFVIMILLVVMLVYNVDQNSKLEKALGKALSDLKDCQNSK